MQSYYNKLRAGESLDDKPRSGRPRIITSTFKRQLGQIKSRHPLASAAFLAQQLGRIRGQPVSAETVRTALKEIGFEWRLRRRQRITSSQKLKRLSFAKAHRAVSWDETWSADECTFNLYRNGNQCWVRVKSSDAEDTPALPKLTEHQQKISISISAALSHGKKATIGFLPKNWNSADLVEVFNQAVYPSIRRQHDGRRLIKLIWDNDGRHMSAEWKALEARTRLRAIRPFPANSPDLNPIENVFAWLKAKVESSCQLWKQPYERQF